MDPSHYSLNLYKKIFEWVPLYFLQPYTQNNYLDYFTMYGMYMFSLVQFVFVFVEVLFSVYLAVDYERMMMWGSVLDIHRTSISCIIAIKKIWSTGNCHEKHLTLKKYAR